MTPLEPNAKSGVSHSINPIQHPAVNVFTLTVTLVMAASMYNALPKANLWFGCYGFKFFFIDWLPTIVRELSFLLLFNVQLCGEVVDSYLPQEYLCEYNKFCCNSNSAPLFLILRGYTLHLHAHICMKFINYLRNNNKKCKNCLGCEWK